MEISSSISRRARCFTDGLSTCANRSQTQCCEEKQSSSLGSTSTLFLLTPVAGAILYNLVERVFKMVVIEGQRCDKRASHTSRRSHQVESRHTRTLTTTTTTKWVSRVLQVSYPNMHRRPFRYSSSLALALVHRGRRSRRSTRNTKSIRCLGARSQSTRPCPFISSLSR